MIMKKSHILIIILIAGAVGVLISTAGDASTYVGFGEAYEMATAGNKKDIHVVGVLKKDDNGNIVGIEQGIDRVSFSFIIIDENGK
jgi:cytochrome c-type biogenesis protein CcmE